MFRPIYHTSFLENLDRLVGATLQGIAAAGNFLPITPNIIKKATELPTGKIDLSVDEDRHLVFDMGLWLFEKNEDGTLTVVKRTPHALLFPNDPYWTRCKITLAD
jgi:hypothetical protein